MKVSHGLEPLLPTGLWNRRRTVGEEETEGDIMGTGVLIEKVVLWEETIKEELGMMQGLLLPSPAGDAEPLHWVTVEQRCVQGHVVSKAWALKPRETRFRSKSPTFQQRDLRKIILNL